MKNPTIKIKEHLFTLSPRKTIFWHNKSTLLLSDLHLGKGTNAETTLLEMLVDLENAISEFQIKRIIITGDLFDAKCRIDLTPFKTLLKKFNTEVVLVLGNHDILDLGTYKDLGIKTVVEELKEDMFIFSHKPIKSEKVNIHGHLHPAVIVKGKVLACVRFNSGSICLPPFGGVIGKCIYTSSEDHKLYSIDETSIKQIRHSK